MLICYVNVPDHVVRRRADRGTDTDTRPNYGTKLLVVRDKDLLPCKKIEADNCE